MDVFRSIIRLARLSCASASGIEGSILDGVEKDDEDDDSGGGVVIADDDDLAGGVMAGGVMAGDVMAEAGGVVAVGGDVEQSDFIASTGDESDVTSPGDTSPLV